MEGGGTSDDLRTELAFIAVFTFAQTELPWFPAVLFVTISGLRWGWRTSFELGIPLVLEMEAGRIGDGEETA